MANEYLVAFKKDSDDVAETLLTDNGCEIVTRYEHLPTVFVVKTEDITKVSDIVEYTELLSNEISLMSPEWHKHRIVTPYLPLRKDYDPLYTGKGVNVYIVDCDFGVSGKLFIGSKSNDAGHGDAMYSIAKSVAPDANFKLVDVSAKDGKVDTLNLVTIFNKIAGDAKKNSATSIVNMSWGIPRNPAIDLVLSALFENHNLIGVCAAGNDGTPLDEITPAGNPFLYTVGASDKYDRVLEYKKNDDFYKPVGAEALDFFAPGVEVEFELADGTTITRTGTSISSAVAAGAIAHFAEAQPTKEEILDNFEGSLLVDTLYIHSSVSDAVNKMVYVPNKFNYTVWGTDSGLIGEFNSGTGIQEIELGIRDDSAVITESDYAALPENVTLEHNVLSIDTDNAHAPGLYNITLVASKNGNEYTRSFSYTIDQDASTENPKEYFYDKTSGTPTYIESEIVTYLLRFFKF